MTVDENQSTALLDATKFPNCHHRLMELQVFIGSTVCNKTKGKSLELRQYLLINPAGQTNDQFINIKQMHCAFSSSFSTFQATALS